MPGPSSYQQSQTPHFTSASRNFSPPLHSAGGNTESSKYNVDSLSNPTANAAGPGQRPEGLLVGGNGHSAASAASLSLGDLSKSALGDVSRRLNDKTNEIKSLVTNERRLQLALQTLERDFNHNRQVLEELETDKNVLMERISDRDNVIDSLKERLEKTEHLHEEDRVRMEKLERDAELGTKGLSAELEQLQRRNLELLEERNTTRLQVVESQQSTEIARKDYELQLAEVRAQLDRHREDVRIGVIREFEDKQAFLKSKVERTEETMKESQSTALDIKNELQRVRNENARIVRAEQDLKSDVLAREQDIERLEGEVREISRRHQVEIDEWRRKLEISDEQIGLMKKDGSYRNSEVHVAYDKKCAEYKVLENQIDALRQEHESNLKKLRLQSQNAVQGIEQKVEALEEKARSATRERDRHKDAEDRVRRQMEDTRQEVDRLEAERDGVLDQVSELKRKLQQKDRETVKLNSEVNFLHKLVSEKEAEVEGMSAAMSLRERRDQREMSSLAAARADDLKQAGRLGLRSANLDHTALSLANSSALVPPQYAFHPSYGGAHVAAVQSPQSGPEKHHHTSLYSRPSARTQQQRGGEPSAYDVGDDDGDEVDDQRSHIRRGVTTTHRRRSGSRGRGSKKKSAQNTDLNVSDAAALSNSEASESSNVSKGSQETERSTIIRLYESLLATARDKSRTTDTQAVKVAAVEGELRQAADESVRLRSERLAALDALTQAQTELNAAHELAAKAQRDKLDAEARAERLEHESQRAATTSAATVASTIHPDTSYTTSNFIPEPSVFQKPPHFTVVRRETQASPMSSSSNSKVNMSNNNSNLAQHVSETGPPVDPNQNASASRVEPYTSPGDRLEAMKEKILAMSRSRGDSYSRSYIEDLAESAI